MKNKIVTTASALLMLLSQPVATFAAEEELLLIEKACEELYPKFWSDFLSRRECVNTQSAQVKKTIQERKKREEDDKRETNARECISSDLKRMEDQYLSFYETISKVFQDAANKEPSENISSNDIESIIKKLIINDTPQKVVADDNVREKILVSAIRTKCNSAFHFLINIRLDTESNVRWFRAYLEHPPRGYNDSVVEKNKFLDLQAIKNLALQERRFKEKRLEEEALIEKAEREEKEKEQALAKDRLSKIASPYNPGFSIDLKTGCRVWNHVPHEGEEVSWAGDCVNGVAEGFGRAIFARKEGSARLEEKVIGYFQSGELGDGPFSILQENGNLEEGTYKNKQLEGAYTLIDKNKKILKKLNFKNGQREGFGIETDEFGSRYEGYFVNNKAQGSGKTFNKDGDLEIEGFFKDGLLDGFSTLYYKNGTKYEGYFSSGKGNGKGILSLKGDNGKITSIRIKAKNDCFWNEDSKTFNWNRSTPEAKCKVDGFPY